MLGNNTLLFPSIVYSGETTLRKSNTTTSVYKLSWHKKKFKYHEEPMSNDDTEYVTALPEPYDTWIEDMHFVLNGSYINEIRECAKSAAHRWKNYPFDTMIREICLEPSIAYIWTSFRLLADCIYNPGEEYFDRSFNTILVPYALCYKFWRNQTGRGLVQEHSRFDRLRERFNFMIEDPNHKWDELKVIDDFFGAIREHEEKVEKAHSKKYPGPSVESGSTGPDKESA